MFDQDKAHDITPDQAAKQANPPIVQITMPAEWQPGRCIVPYDMAESCPFSHAGCWARVPIKCPLYKSIGDKPV